MTHSPTTETGRAESPRGVGYMALIEAQSRPHSIIYQMPAKEFSTGAEALADSRAVHARLRPVVVTRIARPALPAEPTREPPTPPPAMHRRRDYITVMRHRANDKGACPEWMWRPILHEVLAKYDVTEMDVKRDIRPGHVVAARQELYYRMRTELSVSFERIGRLLGDRDHTSVRHGYLKHKAKLEAAGL